MAMTAMLNKSKMTEKTLCSDMSIGLSTMMSRGSRGGTKHLEMNGVIVICCWFPWQPIPCKDLGHVEAAIKYKQCAGSQDESDYGVRPKVTAAWDTGDR